MCIKIIKKDMKDQVRKKEAWKVKNKTKKQTYIWLCYWDLERYKRITYYNAPYPLQNVK